MCLVYCFLFILNFEWKFDLPQTYKWLLQESQSLEDTVCFRQNDIKIKCNIKMWSSAAAAGWMYDPWEQTAADAFCSTHLLMLTFSKQPVPTGTSDDKTKMAVRATKWRLFLLTPCILKPAAVFSVDCSETFHIFKIEMDSGRGGASTQRSVPHLFPPWRTVSRKWCDHHCGINSHENHRLAGRLPTPPPPPPHPQTITGHPGSSPCCCCLWKLQAVA